MHTFLPEKNPTLTKDISNMSCDEFYDYVEHLVVYCPYGYEYAFETIDAFEEFLKYNNVCNLSINLKGYLTDIVLYLNVLAHNHTATPNLKEYMNRGNILIEKIDTLH